MHSALRLVLLALAAAAVSVLATALLAPTILLGQPPAPRGDGAAFARAAEAMLQAEARGNAVLVLLDGGRIAHVAAASQGAPVDADSVFQVASLSKWITAWGVMRLVQEGRIGLDDPVGRHLGRWQLPASEFGTEGVTVRRLLSHTAGLTDGLGYMGFLPGEPVQSLEASLTHAADAAPFASGEVRVGAEPGGGWRYSGGGYALLQLLVEEVTGESFAAYMDRAVLGPLGMTSSTFELDRVPRARLAQSFDPGGRVVPIRRYTALAATSLFTTGTDLAAFLAAHGEGPQDAPPGRGVLSPETLALMRAPAARQLGLPIWGLGTMLYARDGQGSFVIGHEGGNAPAITTTARFNPATGDGIVVLQTGSPGLPARLRAEWVHWQTGRADILVLANGLFRLAWVAASAWLLLFALFALAAAIRRRR
jgi:CubicO group peptidase (beta-lactamase class C family)